MMLAIQPKAFSFLLTLVQHEVLESPSSVFKLNKDVECGCGMKLRDYCINATIRCGMKFRD